MGAREHPRYSPCALFITFLRDDAALVRGRERVVAVEEACTEHHRRSAGRQRSPGSCTLKTEKRGEN